MDRSEYCSSADSDARLGVRSAEPTDPKSADWEHAASLLNSRGWSRDAGSAGRLGRWSVEKKLTVAENRCSPADLDSSSAETRTCATGRIVENLPVFVRRTECPAAMKKTAVHDSERFQPGRSGSIDPHDRGQTWAQPSPRPKSRLRRLVMPKLPGSSSWPGSTDQVQAFNLSTHETCHFACARNGF
jgi:hypothetical protein